MRRKPVPRLSLLGRERGGHRLLLSDGIAQGIAVQTWTGRSVPKCSLVLKIVLHKLAAGRRQLLSSDWALVGNFPFYYASD